MGRRLVLSLRADRKANLPSLQSFFDREDAPRGHEPLRGHEPRLYGLRIGFKFNFKAAEARLTTTHSTNTDRNYYNQSTAHTDKYGRIANT